MDKKIRLEFIRIRKNINFIFIFILISTSLNLFQICRPQPIKQIVIEKPIENKLINLPNVKSIRYYKPKGV